MAADAAHHVRSEPDNSSGFRSYQRAAFKCCISGNNHIKSNSFKSAGKYDQCKVSVDAELSTTTYETPHRSGDNKTV